MTFPVIKVQSIDNLLMCLLEFFILKENLQVVLVLLEQGEPFLELNYI